VQLCAVGSFTAVSVTVRTQFTAHLFTVAVAFSGTLFNSYSAPLQNLQGDSITRDFERWIKDGSGNGESVSVGAVCEEPGARALLLGTATDMPSKALEMGVCFYKTPSGGTWRGAPFLGPSG